jgi:hypothetical protein
MKKKIAILVRDRKAEALRMAVGATLSNDDVSVFIMDDKLEIDDEVELNIEMLSDLKAKIYSNHPENPFEQKTTVEIGLLLSEYDVVIPY